MKVVRTLTKHGGSYYVPIPLKFVNAAGLTYGEHVIVTLEPDSSIRIARIHDPAINAPPITLHL